VTMPMRRERTLPDRLLTPKFAKNEVVRISLYNAKGKFKNELAQKARRYFADIALVMGCSIFEKSGRPVLVYRVKAEDETTVELTEDCLMPIESRSRLQASTAGSPSEPSPKKEGKEEPYVVSDSGPGEDEAETGADETPRDQPASSAQYDPQDSNRLITDNGVGESLQEELRNAALELAEEQRKAIKQAVEESKAIIREVVEEQKARGQSRTEEIRQSLVRFWLG
jgi:hypothetical protein